MSDREGDVRFEQIEIREMTSDGLSVRGVSYEKRLQQFRDGKWVDVSTVRRDRFGEYFDVGW